MAELSDALVLPRHWRLPLLAGAACFPVSWALFAYVKPAGDWFGSASPQAVALFCAALAAALAMAMAGLFQVRNVRIHNRRMRVALDNMSQGLCMFDANERLVVCNQRYMDMYKLTSDVVRPGTTLSALLEHRVSIGTFSRNRNIEEYRRELLASMTQGSITSTEVKSTDGRVIAVINRPMKGGGWVATHEDITERRDAEQERALMQEQQQAGEGKNQVVVVDDGVDAGTAAAPQYD